jgi:hypothetical protein
MITRGKSLRPGGSNKTQLDRLHSAPKGVPAKGYSSGKVFRKNAGRPWSRATQLG